MDGKGRLLSLTLAPEGCGIRWLVSSMWGGAIYQSKGKLESGRARLVAVGGPLLCTSRWGDHHLTLTGTTTLREDAAKSGIGSWDTGVYSSFVWTRCTESAFFLCVDPGYGKGFEEATFDSLETALAAASPRWYCWVLYCIEPGRACDGRAALEVANGGVGFTHGRIRAYAAMRLRGSDDHGAFPSGATESRGANESVDSANRAELAVRAKAQWSKEATLFPALMTVGIDSVARSTASEPPVGSPTDGAEGRGRAPFMSHLEGDESLNAPLRLAWERVKAIAWTPSFSLTPDPNPSPTAPATAISADAASASLPNGGEPSETSTEEAGAAPPVSPCAASGDEVDDVSCAEFLYRLVLQIAGSGGCADDLIERLSAVLEAEAPTDAEMARLRRLQDLYHMGRLGYACSTAWLSALYARTELCIRARSRLTAHLLRMEASRLVEVRNACSVLLEVDLPELLDLLAAKKSGCVEKLRQDVAMQEVSVRSAKGLAAAAGVVGSALAFTPAAPVGLGLLAAGGGVGLTTSGGDMLGIRMQKQTLLREMDTLTQAEATVQGRLAALVEDYFGDVPDAEWEAARGAGVDFLKVAPTDSELAGTLAIVGAGVGTTAAGTKMALLSQATLSAGMLAVARTMGVVGAGISLWDFSRSLANSNPNTEALDKLTAFLEARAEVYRVWQVLLSQWCALDEKGPAEPSDFVTAGGGATAVARVSMDQVDQQREAALVVGMRNSLVHAFASDLDSPRNRGR
jgi:hypothetical protein